MTIATQWPSIVLGNSVQEEEIVCTTTDTVHVHCAVEEREAEPVEYIEEEKNTNEIEGNCVKPEMKEYDETVCTAKGDENMVNCILTVHIHCTTKDSEKQGIEQNDRNSDEQTNGTLYTKHESNGQSVNVDTKGLYSMKIWYM